jgi:hypothetical protein
MSYVQHTQAASQGFHLVAALWTSLAVIGAAIRAAAAVESRVTPTNADLQTLGINPKAFPKTF